METGAAIAIAAGALVLVFVLNRRSEAATAMQVAQIGKDKSSALLGAGDVIAGTATVVATVYGGPAAGSTAWKLSGERL